jgi:hypothetical protein
MFCRNGEMRLSRGIAFSIDEIALGGVKVNVPADNGEKPDVQFKGAPDWRKETMFVMSGL